LKGLTGQSRIINVRSETNLSEGIDEARDVLLSGGVVAFPTESFYGLAVNPMDDEAIDLLFRLKKREPDQPILVLIPFLEALELYASEIPEIARTLTRKFWPGGLTLLFKATPRISQRLTAGTGKIGVRLSSHPVATALAQSINSPITGTSANLSGYPACTNAMEVYNYFKMGVLILDGGETAGGNGSTILDVSVTPPKIIREGMIAADQLGMG
jgi:L-threonylcarbamoyladenylate synthase